MARTIRARDVDDAVRRVLGLDDAARVTVGVTADLSGWRAVSVDGAESGRIRPHQRMRFRRD